MDCRIRADCSNSSFQQREPDDAGDDIARGRLAPVLREFTPLPGSGIYALYPARRHLPLKVRLFIDLLVERRGPEPPWDAWRRN